MCTCNVILSLYERDGGEENEDGEEKGKEEEGEWQRIGGERRKNKEGVGGIIFHTSSSKWILNVKGKHPKDNTGKKIQVISSFVVSLRFKHY